MKTTQCIRVFADLRHIHQCQDRLMDAHPTLSSLANVLNLAGNEVRLKILFLLFEEQKLCVCDIADVLNMNVSAVSQHLRKLKDGGVVGADKVGQTIFYYLQPAHLPLLKPLFATIAASTLTKLN
ncbi:MAG: hypothetical protein NVSMB30_30350 [Hymenobacter sp.]